MVEKAKLTRTATRRLAGEIRASLRGALDHAAGKSTGTVSDEVNRRDRRPEARLQSSRDHSRALEEIERLMDAKRDTPEGERLDLLASLVEAWEADHA
jgi:hypothetical protein